MDISILTEQRREMVINLLKGMKIRKSDGEGFDKDDVYACMQQLCDVYEKSIDDLTGSYEAEINELQDKYQKYDENNDLYISLIMEAKKSSNEIINKAKSEVDEILAAGKEQIAQQEAEIEQIRASAAQEKADLAAELEAARAAAEKEKADLVDGVADEKNRAEAVRVQYRDQIAVMDQEFDEIKTNILRTAGKIDGLRAQLEESGVEVHWELQDEPAPAAEPEPEAAEAPAAPEELTFEQLVNKLQQEDAAKAVQTAEVEAPAEPPVVEPEIGIPAGDEPAEGFNFEPAFDTPRQEEPEIPAVDEDVFAAPIIEPPLEFPETEPVAEELPPIDMPEPAVPVEAPVEAPAPEIPAVEFPAPEIPEEKPVQELSIDDLVASIPAEAPEAPVQELSLDEVVAEAPKEAVPETFTLDSVVEEAKPEVPETSLGSIEELSLEEIGVEAPAQAPAAEEPIEEISFEGLEELFKE